MANARKFTFHIETLGCPKNKVDSRRMKASMLDAGFGASKSSEEADFLLINSCSFIKEAQQETIDVVFQALSLKKETNQKVGLIGCFAERFNAEVKSEIPELDFTVGTGKFDQIAELIMSQYNILPETSPNLNRQHDPDHSMPHAYLRTATGCSRNCAFCILPTIRGAWSPFSMDSIQQQVQEEKLFRRGKTPLREVVLVSQDTVSMEIETFRLILEQLSKDDEVEWIRLQYLFPDRKLLALLDLFKEFEKLTPYIDMPIQHSSPKILKAMKRPSDTAIFKEIIEKAKAIKPGLEVRSSFIIGFPGEDQEDVEYLKHSIDDLHIEKLALFRYSHEKGTSAGDKLNDDLSNEVKVERMNQVREYHLERRSAWRNELLGKVETVLVESVSSSEVIARRACDSPEIDEQVYLPFKAGIKPGDLIPVTLDTAMEYDWIADYNN
jgi:ribosomal protein S12 methylthiotransferase